ncbi:MAG: short chain dehydrogenase [Paracoccaceae bacterium]
MKIVIVGANGDIGQAVCRELGDRHDLIQVGRSSGDIQMDMSDLNSIAGMYTRVGSLDAVIVTAGDVCFKPLDEHIPESMLFGLQQKLMGQINLVLMGLKRLNANGSFTLTSGILDRDPVRTGTGAATANAGLGGFVKSAAIEMPLGLRINVVSPGILDVSVPRYGASFPGHVPVSSLRVGRAFAKSVEGAMTGQVITVD